MSGIDSSPEAIAAMVARLGHRARQSASGPLESADETLWKAAAALLAQVARDLQACEIALETTSPLTT